MRKVKSLSIVVQSPSHVRLFATPWTASCQASLSLTIFPKFAQVHCFSDAIQPSHPLTSSSPSTLDLSRIFPNFSIEFSVCIRWPKYWSFIISPSSEYSGLISLKIDWFDLLAVQRTFRSLLQHHSSKASILWCSAFFTIQLLQPHVTTGKTIALTMSAE